MKTYIPENITYLVEKIGCTQDEFTVIFGLPKKPINSSTLHKDLLKIETVMQICEYFDISLDDFINKSLADKNSLDTIKVETKSDLLKKQSDLIAALEGEVKRLNTEIMKLKS